MHALTGSPIQDLPAGPCIDRIQEILNMEQGAYASLLVKASPDMKELVEQYVALLFKAIGDGIRLKGLVVGGSLESSVKEAIVEEGRQIYRSVGREALGPLVVRFAEHILLNAPEGSTVAFLARDAEPYFEAAKILAEQPSISCRGHKLRYVTLNRQHFQIFDENLAKDQPHQSVSGQEALKQEYLQQHMFDNPKGVVIADTGCWGTMIKKMWGEKAQRGASVLNVQEAYFMYSHNPNIFGFVNEIAAKANRNELASCGVYVGDTFECLPKKEESSSTFAKGMDGDVVPVRVPIDSVCLSAWNDAVLDGVRESAARLVAEASDFPSPLQALSIVDANRLEAREKFTGVLPEATPKWSQGEDFLATWDLPRIPPLVCLGSI